MDTNFVPITFETEIKNLKPTKHETMNTTEINFEINGSKFTAQKTIFTQKIDANGGDAPWKIGTTVKTSSTAILNENGEYIMNFSFNFSLFKKGGIYQKNILRQLEQMINS